jgi:pimeloyl-ACP methyl ester carboxylesterase
MIHGFLAAGDTWSRHAQRLIATGSCPRLVRVYDWNTLDMMGDYTLGLELLVDELLEESGASSVDLIGHSAGGGLAYQFLSDAERARKVGRYVHIGSFASEAPPSPEGGEVVPTLNLWSRGDLTVESADIPGATNITLDEEDHYAVATSLRSYHAISSFLYGDEARDEDPRPAPQEGGVVSLSGRALTLGENLPLGDLEVKIWSRDQSGARAEVAAEVVTDAQGVFSVSDLAAQVSYEFVPVLTAEGQPPVQYFTPPLVREDPLVYLRTFPGPGTLASIIVNQLPQSDDQVSLVFFNAHRAFLAGSDSLTLDGQELLTPEVASPENTTIALFVFDVNGDGEGGSASPLFDRFPFLAASDVPLRPEPQRFIEVDYNGLKMNVPARSSAEGTMILMFP